MSRATAMIELGASSYASIMSGKKESIAEDRSQSIQKFIYFACTFSSAAYNFDIFSQVCAKVKITDFVILEATIGIGYMCMDSFIKQYTKRFDCNKYLNPLLKGVSYGRFMQTSIFVIIHSTYLADSLRFLVFSARKVPPWTICLETNETCISSKDISVRCRNNLSTDFYETSAFQNYVQTFRAIDRNTLTTGFFVLGLVWMLVFFVASVSEETVIKIFKLAFLLRVVSTWLTLGFLCISTDVPKQAFSEMVDITREGEFMSAFKIVTYAYGIGFLGIYDFGTLSAFTMIDTASVIFAVTFTILALSRSMVVKILLLTMSRCVTLSTQEKLNMHLLYYSVLPLSTDFMYAHKLYVFYFYGNMLIGTLIYMTNLILILAKFLSYEFRSVKMIYIVGLLTCVGLACSFILTGLFTHIRRGHPIYGLDLVVSYLGGFYAAIVMWLYGLKKFCTDIQFWLNFRPTRFWVIVWSLLPVALFAGMIAYIYEISLEKNLAIMIITYVWSLGTVLVVAMLQIKALVGFLIKNNLAGLVKSSKKYGPPDPEDRKRRLYYSEYTRQRICKHHCLVIDEWFDCNHQIVIKEEDQSGTSETSSSQISLMKVGVGARTSMQEVQAF